MPRRGASPEPSVPIDADRIAPRLYQGAVPPEGDALKRLGFSMVALCACEHQPPSSDFPGLRVVRAPLDDLDEPVSWSTWETARLASRPVAVEWLRGGRVLVTCAQGRNRSGLVTALALLRLTSMSGEDAVRLVQAQRPRALTNPYFVDAILSAA